MRADECCDIVNSATENDPAIFRRGMLLHLIFGVSHNLLRKFSLLDFILGDNDSYFPGNLLLLIHFLQRVLDIIVLKRVSAWATDICRIGNASAALLLRHDLAHFIDLVLFIKWCGRSRLFLIGLDGLELVFTGSFIHKL